MKKVLRMLMTVAMFGLGMGTMAKENAAGSDKGTKQTTKNIPGVVKVSGTNIKLVVGDREYVLKPKPYDRQVLADLKARDGQAVQITGIIQDKEDAIHFSRVYWGRPTLKGKAGDDKGATPAPGQKTMPAVLPATTQMLIQATSTPIIAANGSGTQELRIIRAAYGAKDAMIDVMAQIRAAITNNTLSIRVNNRIVDRDPVPGHSKELQVTYALGTQQFTSITREGFMAVIPSPSDTSFGQVQPASNAKPLSAPQIVLPSPPVLSTAQVSKISGMVPSTSRGSEEFVVEGVGFGKIRLGQKEEEIRTILGQPTSVHQGQGYSTLNYGSNHVVCILRDSGELFQINFEEGCTWRLQSGVGLGSSVERMFQTVGQPKNSPPYPPKASSHATIDRDAMMFESPTKGNIEYLHKGISFNLSKGQGSRVSWFCIYRPVAGQTTETKPKPPQVPQTASPQPAVLSTAQVSKINRTVPETVSSQPVPLSTAKIYKISSQVPRLAGTRAFTLSAVGTNRPQCMVRAEMAQVRLDKEKSGDRTIGNATKTTYRKIPRLTLVGIKSPSSNLVVAVSYTYALGPQDYEKQERVETGSIRPGADVVIDLEGFENVTGIEKNRTSSMITGGSLVIRYNQTKFYQAELKKLTVKISDDQDVGTLLYYGEWQSSTKND